ncbi:MAG: hypothetical protein KDN20_16415 [Verrucomicrobiae bacterium]|nr:hypothetical protein [Verrucomicrobiae bacterium]
MTRIEALLKQGLDDEPFDWSVRLELAEKLATRGAGDEFDQLLREAPVAPQEEAQAHRLVELANQCECWEGLKQALALFAATKPDSAWGRLAYAQTLLHTGDAATALVHYRHARRLDDSLHDDSLAVMMAEEEAKTAPAPKAEVEVVAEETIVPVTPPARTITPPQEEEVVAAHPDTLAADPASKTVPNDSEVMVVEAAEEDEAEAHDPSQLSAQSRSFIVADGEMVHAHEKQSDSREKLSSIAVAVLIHVAIFVLLGFVGLAMPRPKPPQITASAIANLDSDILEQNEVKKIKRAPVQTASAQMQVTTVQAASAVSMPEINTTLTTFDPIGAGDSFGTSMSFDMGEDGGMVSFFGAKSVSKKVIFVVDFSASMRGEKDKLMRKELAKSVESLPNGVQYQIILFSGPAWYAGQETSKAKKIDEHIGHIVKDGRKEYVWYEGWDKSQRHGGGKSSALYHFSEGEDKLPSSEYITATRANLKKSLKALDDTPLSFGTDWRWPLRMAINMEPDTIYFMTDGSFSTAKGVSKKEMIDELLTLNRKKGKASINTICMMVLNARTELEQLADGTRGEFTLVLEDGTVVRGKELDKVGKKK